MELKDCTNLDLQGDIIYNHFEMMANKRRQENYQRMQDLSNIKPKQSWWISMLRLVKII